jgi:hypothetical protein
MPRVPQSRRLVFDHGDGARVWFEMTVTLQEILNGTLITLRSAIREPGTAR